MIKCYVTPNGVKLFRDTETNAIFIGLDLAPAIENTLIETSVTFSGTTTGDPYEFFTEREPKDGEFMAMLGNIINTNQDKKTITIAKYLFEKIDKQDWLSE